MAPPAGTLRVGRYFLALLAILAVLYAIVFWPGQRHAPKLGIDLAGGQQVIFKAVLPGGKTPSKSSMEEAQQIIEERVNGSGVTESTVVIQGDNEIVVSIPGASSTDVNSLGKAAVLNFRPVIAPSATQVSCTVKPTTTPSGSTSPSTGASGSPTAPTSAGGSSAKSGASNNSSDSAKGAGESRLADAPTSPTSPAAGSGGSSAGTPTSPAATPTAPAPTGATPPTYCQANPLAALGFPMPTSYAAFSKLSSTQQSQITAALVNFNCGVAQGEADIASKNFLACDGSGYAYLLAPVIVPGKQIDTASAQAPNPSQGQTEWTVSLKLKGTGQTNWSKYTAAHNIGSTTGTTTASSTTCGPSSTPCDDFVAFTLDGQVISAPVNEGAINGDTQISGGFTQSSSKSLARELKYGALPVSFRLESNESVSATLGSSQLKAGLLAGGIGLILVIIYSLVYYRALGLVTISSLVVSAGLTYACLVILGKQIGFVLSLAGIAGFIVAIGITADSFVVFFERLKDEVHEGRSMRVAVPRAWVRARRTILSADTVSFLAAAILYYFAAGDVRGFAFTLGLSTILDLVVVFLFTHPLVSTLSRSRAFGSARFTGLDALRGVAIPDDDERPARPSARERARRADPVVEPEKSERFAGVAVIDRKEDKAVEEDETADALEVEEAEPETDDAVIDESDEAGVVEVDEGEPETEVDETDLDEAEPEADEDEVDETESDSVDSTDEDVENADDEAERTRRRTTPEPGSAAERAAARRARLRAQRDQKGKN